LTTDIGRLGITIMSQHEAEAISDWRYEPPYDFYDWPADEDDLAELLDPAQRRQSYFSAVDTTGELVGFFDFRLEDAVVNIGLGLRPDLTGRGLGRSFLEVGLTFAREQFAPTHFGLRVADFNVRAIKVYERAGFVTTRSFMHKTNGGLFSFVKMERRA
jgi:[ribosomal protein S18]-alanine N-acetyltransferase